MTLRSKYSSTIFNKEHTEENIFTTCSANFEIFTVKDVFL